MNGSSTSPSARDARCLPAWSLTSTFDATLGSGALEHEDAFDRQASEYVDDPWFPGRVCQV